MSDRFYHLNQEQIETHNIYVVFPNVIGDRQPLGKVRYETDKNGVVVSAKIEAPISSTAPYFSLEPLRRELRF